MKILSCLLHTHWYKQRQIDKILWIFASRDGCAEVFKISVSVVVTGSETRASGRAKKKMLSLFLLHVTWLSLQTSASKPLQSE